MEPQALLNFLTAVSSGTDAALDPEFAVMASGKSRAAFYRLLKEGKIPVLIQVGRFTRFSRVALNQALAS